MMAKSPKLSLSVASLLLFGFVAFGQQVPKDKQYYLDKARKNFPQTSKEYRYWLDSAIVGYPNDAELWREVATSFFKAGEYGPAMRYINKAVELDPKQWLGYRAFMKCIFMKDYAPAIEDFKQALDLKNNYYEMDHTYHFYIAISYLKLNQLDSADYHIAQSLKLQMPNGQGSGHHLDWFYWGLIKHRKKQHKKAIEYYDKALTQYENFPDAMYYKALVLLKTGEKQAAKVLLENAQKSLKKGYKLNEDNEYYVNYPYQITPNEVNELLQKNP